MNQQPQQVKHTLPTIEITDGRTGREVKWRMSQPVQIWSVGACKWCPGEISYITQDADGYCLDVRYWAKPQLPKAKYLAPLSECLRPISSDFTCRNEWTSGSKVECFSNSQKRWYKATVVDVIRYPDDKEDWLKIQWSLDISSNYSTTPTSNTSNTPQIMSKEVGRSSIWIRHRYPSFKNQSPPNMDNQTPKQGSQSTPNNQRKKPKKSKKKFKREKDMVEMPQTQIQSRTSNDSNRSKIKMDEMMDSIISSLPSRGPPSKEVSYSMPDPYNSNMIRKFDAQSQNNSFINEENDNHHNYGGPSISNKSKKVSATSQHFGHLTPQFEAVSSKNKQEEAMFDYILDKMDKHNNNNDDNKEGIDAIEQTKNDEMETEFGAEFKPNDYKQKANVKEMDLEMEKAFMQSDSSEDESEIESGFHSNDGSVVVKSSEDDEEESESDNDDEIDSSDDNQDKPLIPQSETRKAESTGNSWDEEKKEFIQEIEELKFRLQIAEQDLNEERETSGPLLKEVEMQKIRIAKLDEQITKLNKKQRNNSDLSPNDEIIENNENNDEEMTAKLEEFKKSIATPKNKSKRHQRSQSFTSQSSLYSNLSDIHCNDDIFGNPKKNRFEGLKAQELIDAIYDRKVTLLNDQILRLQSDLKKKDNKLLEYKAKDRNRKREIQLLESELSDIKHENNAKSRSDTQNISMYRDQVRKLTQTNDALKKALQTADDKLKSAELKKQDLSEEFKAQRQITNNLQQKVQRVLQQNNTIGSQVDALHQIQSISEQNNMRGSHNRHYSTSAAHNHLDTIRKCNMRAIQILHEIIEKNRRKRSDGYSLNKYSRESINMFSGSSNNNKRKSKTDLMDNGLYNSTRAVMMNYSGDDMHDEDYDSYQRSKSTRFSDKKNRNEAKNTNNNIRKSSYNSSHQNTPITNNNQRFDFGDNIISVNDAQSTRSRSYNTHHQQRSEQMIHNMQPLVLKEQKQPKQTKLLSVDEQQQILNNKNNNNGYNIRQKRVSYDYVDGNQGQAKYQQKKQKLYVNQIQSFDENEEDQYQENNRYKPQIRHNQQSMITNNNNESDEGNNDYDMHGYFEKLWIVKFPRRASKVQLFGSNKGHKTQILLDNKYLIFKCDQSNNNLVTKINVIEIKNYEITEKKNLSIFIKNGKKYKIKCEQEKEAHFWYNILTQFISSNSN